MPNLTVWSVFVLVISVAIAYLGGRLLGSWTYRLLYRFAIATRTPDDEKIVQRLRGPLAAAWMVVIWHIVISCFAIPASVLAFARAAGGIAFLVVLAWAGMRVLDAATEIVALRSTWISSHRLSQSLLPVARRVAKIVLAILIAVMVLSELGYSVGPLIAGLGITGIAVALAAQKTLENVFGAFAIGVDHPFHEGDLIRLDNGLVGKVETIGLRSTRLRTFDRTLVTVPNGKLADAQIEALTARDSMRFQATLHLALGTPVAELERVIADITEMLQAHPRRGPEPPQVHLNAVADAWIELDVVAWLATTSWTEFQILRDRLLLRCLELVAAAGVTLHNAPAPTIAPAAPAKPSVPQPRQAGGMS